MSREGGDVTHDYEAVDVARAPRQKLAREMTSAEVRRQRDLVWLMLAQAGLTSREIELVCTRASRDHSQIARRIAAAQRHYGARHAG